MTASYTGRPIKSYLDIRNLMPYFIYFVRSVRIFKNPLLFLYSYIFYNKLKYLKLRNGLILHLSDHPHDCATIFAVFVRRDYGKISKNSVILDIGGNIGLFALYALSSGASHIYICEPNSKSISIIKKNIKFNGFENKATILHNAVTSESNQSLKIPIESSMYNTVSSNDEINDKNTNFEKVTSISLNDIYKKYSKINFTKIDCEGSEYDIILNSSENTLKKVSQYVIEFHKGNLISLIEKFISVGIKPVSSRVIDILNDQVGILHLKK